VGTGAEKLGSRDGWLGGLACRRCNNGRPE
jgi:hypothetical protein